MEKMVENKKNKTFVLVESSPLSGRQRSFERSPELVTVDGRRKRRTADSGRGIATDEIRIIMHVGRSCADSGRSEPACGGVVLPDVLKTRWRTRYHRPIAGWKRRKCWNFQCGVLMTCITGSLLNHTVHRPERQDAFNKMSRRPCTPLHAPYNQYNYFTIANVFELNNMRRKPYTNHKKLYT